MKDSSFDIVGSGEVVAGRRSTISPDAKFIFHRPARVTIGDYCTVGPGVKFVSDGGDITLGDWTSVHDRCLVLSTTGVRIGQHGWFGQNCVIDGTGQLTIGRGVRVGMGNSIWTHVATGEQIEGCTLYGVEPVELEDEVWLVGSSLVSPGVTLGTRSIALSFSNITKSWPAYSTLAGSPASPKEGLHFYRPIDVEEKYFLMARWMSEICAEVGLDRLDIGHEVLAYGWQDRRASNMVAFTKSIVDRDNLCETFPDATICCLASKRYSKQLTDIEHRVLKSLAGNKARFYS